MLFFGGVVVVAAGWCCCAKNEEKKIKIHIMEFYKSTMINFDLCFHGCCVRVRVVYAAIKIDS